MKTKFVEIHPLFSVIEFSRDVSKGSKQKNHDLPRKFERATFQGNQNLRYETPSSELLYDMNRSY